ncbi:unnamed protein product [Enterobius vermicularis]|uniref:protein-serine/threonine phosphatase n=1 Tax=Enterobius vermicularis TaxID=51028 RepID=A0A0N4V5T9_ENTVE|nr:unnamed protein product [Enterobius vermicularis]
MGAYLNKPVTEKESEVGENQRVRYAASCMQGWRTNQEDAHNCILDFTEDCSLFAVYDGHGGSEVAQYTAMHLPSLLKSKEPWKSGEFAKAIDEAFLEFDDILRFAGLAGVYISFFRVLETQTAMSSDSEQSFDEDYKEEDEVISHIFLGGDTPGEDSGTTACLVLLFKDKVVVGNAGDSRAVLCRKGKAIDLSVDHKPEDASEKRRIEAAGGEISGDGRVNGGLNLSSNLPLKDQMISAQPDVTEHNIEPDDQFVVVACDGIWNSLSSQEVVDFVRTRLATGLSLKDICEKMCDECLSPNTAGDGTGCDNMTVIIAELIHV